MASAQKSKVLLAGLLLYITAIVVAAQFLVYPHIYSSILSALVQFGIYALAVLPFTFLGLKLPQQPFSNKKYLLIGLAFLTAAAAYAAVSYGGRVGPLTMISLNAFSAGFFEEIIFRGYIWQLQAGFQTSTKVLILTNVLLFTVWHVPMWIITHASPVQFLIVLVLGLAFAVIRARTKGLTLPAMLHIAVDMASF